MGSTTTLVMMRTRVVTAAAADSATMMSGFGKLTRSPAARVEKGPASIRRAHSRRSGRSSPGAITGRFMPTSMGAPGHVYDGPGPRSTLDAGQIVEVVVEDVDVVVDSSVVEVDDE